MENVNLIILYMCICIIERERTLGSFGFRCKVHASQVHNEVISALLFRLSLFQLRFSCVSMTLTTRKLQCKLQVLIRLLVQFQIWIIICSWSVWICTTYSASLKINGSISQIPHWRMTKVHVQMWFGHVLEYCREMIFLFIIDAKIQPN